MSTTALAAPVEARSDPAPVEARRRGRLVLSNRVVEKVAAQAAAELPDVRGRSGGVLGLGSSTDADARPKVDVHLAAGSADLDLRVGIAYPGSIREAAQQVREHVSARVLELTGVPVHRVDVEVTFLALVDLPQRQALR